MSPLQSLIHDIQRGKNDSIRIASNTVFRSFLDSLLKTSASFRASFDSIKNVSVVTAPGQKFRVYTWTLPYYDGSRYDFFGYIQMPGDTSGTIRLIPLLDSTLVITKPESEKLRAERWYGSVYYSILENKSGKKTYYTLLGWKGINSTSTQKIADVLYFDRHLPKFGFPLFKTGKVYKNRIIFTYAAQAIMTLKYEDSKNMIIFDHLSGNGTKNETENQLAFGGPDGTYDGLKFKSGKWVLVKDVDIRTDWKPKKQESKQ
ncbi:MAG TPA: hypothetical protein PLU53_05955 [Bacteroidia bacterium]|nr:hypothetical protein [Bacteroidia bacterium]